MTLSRIILGFLSIQPMSGYDLMRAFATSAAYFWHADKAQIYRTLARLVDDGLARTEVIAGTHAPDRVLHHLTDEGRLRLRDWLAQPGTPQSTRDAFVARIFFAGELGDAELQSLIAARVAETTAARDALERIRAQTPAADPATDRAAWLRAMTLDQGIREHQEHLAWLERLRNGIEGAESA
ncbi:MULTISPECIES: PadR family transcriptional regulator [unclassified Microbacterium]|uniref:PadR family transcriptional regulator n=1 Tax=unclassified Microbacterium TaxID=2609290 RepID=UPI0030105EE5